MEGIPCRIDKNKNPQLNRQKLMETYGAEYVAAVDACTEMKETPYLYIGSLRPSAKSKRFAQMMEAKL